MPVNNKRSYGSSSNSGRSNRNDRDEAPRGRKPAGRGGSKGGSFKKKGDFNMLNFGIGFCDILEEDRGLPTKMKARIMLKADKQTKDLMDVVDEKDNEYTPEESAMLLAKALLEGRGISLYLFLNDDDSYGGNARIDINGIELDEDDEEEEEEPAPVPKRKPAAKKTTSGKQSTKTSRSNNYEEKIREAAVEPDEDEEALDIEEEVL